MIGRRAFLGAAAGGMAGVLAPRLTGQARAQQGPYRIYRVTYRGRTDVAPRSEPSGAGDERGDDLRWVRYRLGV